MTGHHCRLRFYSVLDYSPRHHPVGFWLRRGRAEVHVEDMDQGIHTTFRIPRWTCLRRGQVLRLAFQCICSPFRAGQGGSLASIRDICICMKDKWQ